MKSVSYATDIEIQRSVNVYRFGFNGQEKDDEITGVKGSQYTQGMIIQKFGQKHYQ